MMQHSLTLFPEAQAFLDSVINGESRPDTRLTTLEQLLLRRLAGLPIQRHPPEKIATVIALRGEGYNYSQIAKMTGLPVSTVGYHLNKNR